MGTDVLFWLVPTEPALETNYLEKVWSKHETVEMYRLRDFKENPAPTSQYRKPSGRSLIEKAIVVLGIIVVVMSAPTVKE
jgi:hypothetical protein